MYICISVYMYMHVYISMRAYLYRHTDTYAQSIRCLARHAREQQRPAGGPARRDGERPRAVGDLGRA